tara:strand:+ start:294 stop:527 length:234 start_codon:yes stop_codon:yes gene_type:complete
MKKFFDLLYGRPWRWFMGLNFTKKIIFVSIIVVFAILFGERKDANWYYKNGLKILKEPNQHIAVVLKMQENLLQKEN